MLNQTDSALSLVKNLFEKSSPSKILQASQTTANKAAE
jgi:hypothetical protein